LFERSKRKYHDTVCKSPNLYYAQQNRSHSTQRNLVMKAIVECSFMKWNGSGPFSQEIIFTSPNPELIWKDQLLFESVLVYVYSCCQTFK